MIGGRYPLAGYSWGYDFKAMSHHFGETALKRFIERLASQCSKQTKVWNHDLNSQWVCRDYLAVKMILSSSVMLESLEYAEEKNLRFVISYLEYYSVLSLLRAVVFTDPNTHWNSGDVVYQNHRATINNSAAIIAKLDRQLSKTIKEQVEYLKAYRELISYNAPSSGDAFPRLKLPLTVMELCRLLAEVAQLQSEVFERSVGKHAKTGFSLKPDYIRFVCSREIEGYSFDDREDAYRLDYIRRKHPFPTDLLHMMSEGHVEDFFGSWCAKEEEDGVFDPDDDWRIIFDVP
jgi:hypothetical protein